MGLQIHTPHLCFAVLLIRALCMPHCLIYTPLGPKWSLKIFIFLWLCVWESVFSPCAHNAHVRERAESKIFTLYPMSTEWGPIWTMKKMAESLPPAAAHPVDAGRHCSSLLDSGRWQISSSAPMGSWWAACALVSRALLPMPMARCPKGWMPSAARSWLHLKRSYRKRGF